MRLYMAVTNDENELPVAVADSVPELAEMVGKSVSYIYRLMDSDDYGGQYLYKRIEVNDERW